MVGQWICLVLLVAILGIASTHAHVVKLKEHYRRKRSNSCPTCGEFNGDKFNNLIVNGQTVIPRNKYPWMVALVRGRNNAKRCGGAILNEYHVLTAAHCIKSPGGIQQKEDRNTCVFPNGDRKSCFLNPSELGIALLSDSDDMLPGPPIAKMIPHPDYDLNLKVQHDIAIIQLAQPIKCNPYASPICLPKSIELNTSSIVGISGWGASMEEGKRGATKDLRETNIKVLDKIRCKPVQHFPKDGSSVCLSGEGKSGPCFGDSGGSMFQKVGEKYFTMGVASAHTSSKCDTNSLVIYTAVKFYLPWIEKTIGASPTPGSPSNLSRKTKSSKMNRLKRRKHRRRC